MHQNRCCDSHSDSDTESLPNLTFCGTASTKRKSSNFEYQLIYRFLFVSHSLFRCYSSLSFNHIYTYVYTLYTYIYI